MSLTDEQQPPNTEDSVINNNDEGGPDTLESLFEAYAEFGSKKNLEGINIRNINKWFQQAGLMGINGMNSEMTKGIFSAIAGVKGRLDFSEFQTFLRQVEREKGIPLEEIEGMLADAGKPKVTGLREAIRKCCRC